MKSQVSWLAFTLGAFALAGAPSVWAQTTDVTRSGTDVTVETKLNATELDRSNPTRVDQSEQDNIQDAPLSEGDIELVIKLLGALDHDGFSVAPESSLPSDASLHRLADQIIAAHESGQSRKVLDLLKDNDEVREVRPEVNILEAWNTHKLGQYKTAIELFEKLYSEDPSASNAAGILYSGMNGERFTRTYETAEKDTGPLNQILIHASENSLTAETQQEIRKVRVDFLNAWLSAAIKYKKDYTARRVKKLLELEGVRVDVGSELLALAWQAQTRGDFDAALRLFDEAARSSNLSSKDQLQAHYGRALSFKALGHQDRAMTLALRYRAQHGGFAKLHNDILMDQAYAAFDAGEYEAALVLTQKSFGGRALDRDASVLTAWSQFNLKNFEASAPEFEALYRKEQTSDVADGLAASLKALGKQDQLVVLANDLGGPLQGLAKGPVQQVQSANDLQHYQMSEAERATYRGHHLFAAQEDASAFSELDETGIAWIGDTLRLRHRDGDQGLSELSILSGKFDANWTHDLSHFKIEVEMMNLDAGGAHDGTRPVGSWQPGDGPTPFEFPEEEEVVVPRFSWWREGPVTLAIELGTTPIGGESDPTLTGLLQATFHNGPRATTAALYREPVYESILSLTGAQDPVTGDVFGRIVETGFRAETFLPISETWYLSGGVSWGARSGENVEDNGHIKAQIGFAYSVPRDGFSYLSVGPSYRFESYDHNLSHFTFGHGGYYSPETLHNFGITTNFMTEEGKSWLIKGGASAGHQSGEQETAPYYPLAAAPAVDVFGPSEASGVGINAQVQGVWRLSDRWMFEAGGYGQHNDDFSEVGGFLKLRFHFARRAATYSSDLTETLYRRW